MMHLHIVGKVILHAVDRLYLTRIRIKVCCVSSNHDLVIYSTISLVLCRGDRHGKAG